MKYYNEEFSFCEVGIEVVKFEGVKNIKSNQYNFDINFQNTIDFRHEGSIDYSVNIPIQFLESKLCDDIYNQLDFESDDFLEFIAELRCDVEASILEYLKANNLTKEIDYF